MAVCYKGSGGEYAVKTSCYPCLPRCNRSEITYCCDSRPSSPRVRCCEDVRECPREYCCRRRSPRARSPVCHHYTRHSPPPTREPRCCSPPPECCPPPPECCSPPPRYCHSPPPECCALPPDCRRYTKVCCQPVRTKYVIPCYRYEDGRIENQPTVLTRRACEVAVGVRPRRKPFVHSSYSASDDLEVHRFHSEDEMGNCCYHYEQKHKGSAQADSAAVGYTDCVPSTVADPNGCCVYY